MAKLAARSFWASATVFFLTLLLRPPLAVVGPLLGQIQATMQLTPTEVGLLTSAPVLCFGVGAFAGPWLQRRFGLAQAFTGVLVLLAVTIATRFWFGFGYLLVATIVMGLGIAVSNVLFPALIRAEFPNSVPKVTAVYTMLLSGFAALSAGFAVPLSVLSGGWRYAVSYIGIAGVLGLIAWLITLRLNHPHIEPVQSAASINMWRQPLVWAIAGFFGLQSANFYVLLNWLPTILVSEGLKPTEAGAVLGFLSMVGIPVGMVMTANLKRIKNVTLMVTAISVVTAVGLLMFLLGPAFVIPASVLVGVGTSSSFPLSLALIGMKGSSQAITTGLSSVSQGIGYLYAASAVFFAGLSFDLTQTWVVAIVACAAAAVAQAGMGIYAAKHPGI